MTNVEPLNSFEKIGDAAKRVVDNIDPAKPAGPGIYFGMDEIEYHSHPALGSTDIRRVLRSAPDYWWNSWMNPHRPPINENKPTPARLFGKAFHKLVLEGKEAFDAEYVRRPDDAANATPTQKAATTKAANAAAAQVGKQSLHGEDYDRIIVAAEMIARNPNLAGAFDGGASEVSVIWDHPTIKDLQLKVRFDKLKPRGIGDLKSIANERGREFNQACRMAISDHRYDIQAKHYLNGRAVLPDLVRKGLVYGEHDAEWLFRVAATADYGFQWVFFQSGDSPISKGITFSPDNPIAEIAQDHIDHALTIWDQFYQQFGTEMWLLTDPVEELSIDEMPAWFARAA